MAKLNPLLLLGGAAAALFVLSKGKKKSGCRSIQMGDMKFGEFYDRVMAFEEEAPGQKEFLKEPWFHSNKEAFDEKYAAPAASKFKSKLWGAMIEASKNAAKNPSQPTPGGGMKKEGQPLLLMDEILEVFVEAFNEQFPSCTMSVDRIKSKMEGRNEDLPILDMTPNEFLFILFAEGMGEQLG